MRTGKICVSFSLGVVVATAVRSQEIPRVLDMRYPGPGIGTIEVDFGSRVSAGPVRFIGDIDGDGRDELLLKQLDLTREGEPIHCVLLYGASRDAVEQGVDIGSLRQTRFSPDDFTNVQVLDHGP